MLFLVVSKILLLKSGYWHPFSLQNQLDRNAWILIIYKRPNHKLNNLLLKLNLNTWRKRLNKVSGFLLLKMLSSFHAKVKIFSFKLQFCQPCGVGGGCCEILIMFLLIRAKCKFHIFFKSLTSNKKVDLWNLNISVCCYSG